MKITSLAASFMLIGCFSVVSLSAQAEEEQSIITHPIGSKEREIKEGDKAPDKYMRNEMEFKDWKKAGLSQPEEQSQWVEMNDKYVLVNKNNGVMIKMVPINK